MAWKNIVPRKRKLPKVRQIVWLDYETMRKLLEIADKFNVAPNTVISEIVKESLTGKTELFNVQPEKPKKITLILCPLCWKIFPDIETVKKHIIKDHTVEEIKNFVEEIIHEQAVEKAA